MYDAINYPSICETLEIEITVFEMWFSAQVPLLRWKNLL